jgi:hypothetical protein
MILGASARVCTKHLPDTNVELYLYANPVKYDVFEYFSPLKTQNGTKGLSTMKLLC